MVACDYCGIAGGDTYKLVAPDGAYKFCSLRHVYYWAYRAAREGVSA